MALRQLDSPRRRLPWVPLLATLFLGFLAVRIFCSYAIEYAWWQEVGQLDTWYKQLTYAVLPQILAGVLCFVVLWTAHARGLKAAGTGLRANPIYARISMVALLLVAAVLASALVDGWVFVRYFGGHGAGAANAYHDPAFGEPLSFYFFDLPFYRELLTLLLGLLFVAVLLYWLTARIWGLRHQWRGRGENAIELTIDNLRIGEAFRTGFVRILAAIFLIGMAGRALLQRYDLLLVDHGSLTGIEYVSEHVTLPLLWISIAAYLAAAAAMVAGRAKLAVVAIVIGFLPGFLPGLVNALYVRPNELTLQRPYIQRHIDATRSAYGLSTRSREVQFKAELDKPIRVAENRVLLDNVRLWDWAAFHDTVTQIQALRPYYVFADTDVDRYQIDGQLRQVLLTPRELDVRQLPEARTRWINPHFIYTHGYGVVMAEANRITSDGLPVTLIQNAPPEVLNKSLKLTRPELYYGEITHEPVFVHTGQNEFNYPSGAENVHTRYEGSGGFPMSSLPMRFAAALREGDWNILLTSYLTPSSRMMIRRRVRERLQTVAGFIEWDRDPYLVLTDAGRLVWTVDGFTTSAVHPYARMARSELLGGFNYVRNSVKATVDAYDGSLNLYVFDPNDPLINAYARLFPALLQPAERMPADLRAHARYPETLFLAQAEAARTFHMKEAESFYNKEDLWDIAKTVRGQGGQSEDVAATYLIATLPGETTPEFLLMLPFTPRGKNNLTSLLAARCDGPHLGELVTVQLSKQTLLFGPTQIDARIDQDGNISKDLTLWNQQGSQVIRGQMLILPIGQTFLYVEPIYIQSSATKMPQLKKVAIASGNSLAYADTYAQALAQLTGVTGTEGPAIAAPTGTAATTQTATPAVGLPNNQQLEEIRAHWRRYRELSAQQKLVDAARELEAIDGVLRRQ